MRVRNGVLGNGVLGNGVLGNGVLVLRIWDWVMKS
jgi:hypothetical protein